MNRHDKRNLERKFNKMDYKQFIAVQENVENQIREEYQKRYMLTTMCALMGEFGFGLKRLTRFLLAFSSQMKSLSNKAISYDDMASMIEALGFKVKIYNNELFIIHPDIVDTDEAKEVLKNAKAV